MDFKNFFPQSAIVPSQPPDPFERQFDFTSFSQTQPTKQQPGDKIDIELDEARQSINQTISRLNEIQRDDGKLRDGVFDYTEINNLVLIAQGARDDAVTAAQEAQGFADDANGDAQVAVEAAGDAENFSIAANNSAIAALASQNASAASALEAAGYATDAANTYQDFLDSLPLYDQDLNTTNDVQFNKIDITKTTDGSNKSTRYNEDGLLIGNLIGQAGQHYATFNGTGFEFPEVSYYGTSVKLEALIPSLAMAHNTISTSVTSILRENGIDFSSTFTDGLFVNEVRYSNIDADAAVFATTGIAGATDTEVGAWGFGTELTSDNTQSTTVEFDGLHVHNAEGSTHVSWDGITFPDATVQTTAYIPGSGDFLPLAGGTMTGNIIFGTAGQFIGAGTFDTSRGGVNGISLVCSVGYEFNWQAGWLITTEQNSTTPRPLYLDSLAGTTLRVWDSSTSLGTEISHTGITFADATVQSTAYTGQNIFDQSLNTSDAVRFNYLHATDNSTSFPISSIMGAWLYSSSKGWYFDLAGGLNVEDNSGAPSAIRMTGTGITFPNSSVQTTAFPPAGGTVSQYIDGTGALQTLPVVPSASTTVEGTVELATKAEAIAATDTARAITPQTANAVSYLESYDQQDITALSFNAGVSVHSALQAANYKNLNHGTSTAIGSSYLACLNFLQVGNTTQSVGIDWTKKVILSFNLSRSNAAPSAGCVFRACLGKTQAGGAVGDLINTGIGIKIEGSGVVQLMAYRSALVTTNTSYTPNGAEAFAVKLVSYGNGTVECFINGDSVGANTNAPNAIAAAFLYNTTFECQQVAIVATSTQWTVNCIKQSFGKR